MKMTSSRLPGNSIKRFWTSPRVTLTVLVFALGAVCCVSSCNSTDQPKGEPGTGVASQGGRTVPTAPVKTVPTAPALAALPANVRDAELRAISGSPIRLANYSGKVVLVNLWATWCTPCRIEIPELVKLHKEFRSQGLEMVGLSTENPDVSEYSVKTFVRKFKVDYKIGWATPEVAGTLMQGRDAIPQSFIISRDGRIMKRFVGFSPTYTPPQIKQALEEALSDKGKI